MEISRNDLVDDRGRYKTLSLFLEIAYDKDAIFTLKDYDHEYEGKMYYSLKKIYLEKGDPTEYQFAVENLAGWDHWQKICNNKVLAQHIEKWRAELELKLVSEGVRLIVNSAKGKGNWLAAKFLAERGWQTRAAGRPTKEELEKNIAIESAIQSEFEDDLKRFKVVNG